MFILLAWPVLRVVGIPQPTGKSAIFTICSCYFLCGAVIQFRGARAEGGAKQGFIRLVPMLSLLVCMLALVLRLDHFLLGAIDADIARHDLGWAWHDHHHPHGLLGSSSAGWIHEE